ncbi:MAG: protein translocase SEC61 complex subunit gamma [Candidatus Thermoplasmatota archaeon]|nr:protein translocase SEC61 complex subunit gamma [Candidatus Thermoplasmatota archaeon]
MDIVEGSWRVQDKIEEKAGKIGKGKFGRILKMARKPDQDEYKKTLMIVIAGVLLIGGLGFLIFWLWENVPTYFWIGGL